YAALSALRTYRADVLPLADAVRVDGWSLAFCAGAVVATAMLVGLVPALRATRRSLAESVREGGRGAGVGAKQWATQGTLVAAEVGLSLVLLIGAGLLLRSLERLRRVDTGVDATGVVTM